MNEIITSNRKQLPETLPDFSATVQKGGIQVITPTAGTVIKEEAGRKRRIVVRSYVVVLCEVGGSGVKAVRLDKQSTMQEAKQTALADNPGWRFKGLFALTDKDFERGKNDEKGD